MAIASPDFMRACITEGHSRSTYDVQNIISDRWDICLAAIREFFAEQLLSHRWCRMKIVAF
ncbi:hypothetical protein [Rhodopseudomonas faecalis]|uniref:hypothetical protein n=1 Tax=Rhodopseudomonas faecalis TaxID=99655 RepID=UPI001AECCDAB|nr:hypothetical protein [Rhodopseudomonas faecalis]